LETFPGQWRKGTKLIEGSQSGNTRDEARASPHLDGYPESPSQTDPDGAGGASLGDSIELGGDGGIDVVDTGNQSRERVHGIEDLEKLVRNRQAGKCSRHTPGRRCKDRGTATIDTDRVDRTGCVPYRVGDPGLERVLRGQVA
jgi:hypothetical protein